MIFICNNTSKSNEEELISLISCCDSYLFKFLERLIMLEKMEFYLTFGMRALIFLLIMILGGTVLFVNFIPDSFSVLSGVVDLQPAKRILYTGFLVVILINFIKIWYDDYQRQYIPHWLR